MVRRLLLWLLFWVTLANADEHPAGIAALIAIDGAIGPATAQHVVEALDRAEQRQARLVVLRLDTPGGLDEAMRHIIKRILLARVPVVAYVAPSGARAASAGTYILYACHVAAMAPATNLGAATPVPVLPHSPPDRPDRPGPERKNDDQRDDKPERPPPGDASERKTVNDAVAYLRSLAEQRGRNADWAERAVREGASLSAEQALKQNVIELIAADVPALLRQLEGRTVQLPQGAITLHSRDLRVEELKPSWRLRLLAVLTNPTVAYLLLLIGIYGLLLEGYSPGAILPGVLGGICLLLALYAFQILPVNYVGLALIALGITLIVAETMIASAGILGIGGVIAFVIGSIMLLDTGVPGFELPLAIIAAVATAASGALLLVLYLLMRARRQRVVTGHEAMLTETAIALEDFTDEGWVRAHGETWRARCAVPVVKGQRLRVVKVEGLVLEVDVLA